MTSARVGVINLDMRLRLCFNGQQVHGSFSSMREAAQAQIAQGDDYGVTWIQERDSDTGEWFGVSRARFEKAARTLRQ